MYIIVIVSILASIIMVAAILLQNPKSGGAGPMMGGSSQLIGFQRTTDILEKTTWVGIMILFLVCITYGVFQGSSTNTESNSDNLDAAKNKKVNLPAEQVAPIAKDSATH